jgi:hypothetical protein
VGLLDFLFGRRDPALDWPLQPGLKLEVDLSDASLGGVKLNDPIERLSGLGPPENAKPTAQTGYDYYSRGLEIGADASGRLQWFCCFWGAPDRPRHRLFEGAFLWKGRPVPIDGRTPAEEIVKLFGDPYHVDEDEEETILRYYLDGVEWELEFARGAGLRAFLLDAEGLFADPVARENYGITRPWPPLPGQGRPV